MWGDCFVGGREEKDVLIQSVECGEESGQVYLSNSTSHVHMDVHIYSDYLTSAPRIYSER